MKHRQNFFIRLCKLFTMMLLWVATPVHAQVGTAITDSLEQALLEAVTDSVKVFMMSELSREYAYVSPGQAQYYGIRAVRLAQEAGLRETRALALRNFASINLVNGYYRESLELLEDARTIFEDLGDSLGMANVYISMGVAYNLQKQGEEAVAYHLKALPIFKALGNTERTGVCYNNIGEGYTHLGRYARALSYLDSSATINEAMLNYPVLSANMANMARIYQHMQRTALTLSYADRCITLSKTLGSKANNYAYAEALIIKGEVLLQQDNVPQAIEVLLAADSLAGQMGYYAFAERARQTLADISYRNNDAELGSYYTNSAIAARDSLRKISEVNNLDLIKSVREASQKEEELALLRENQILQEQFIQRQQILIFSILVILFLIVAVIMLISYNTRNRRKAYKLLTEQNDQIARQREEIRDQRDDILEKNRKLLITKEQLEEAHQTKNRFLSLLAHDLRGMFENLQTEIKASKENNNQSLQDAMNHATQMTNKVVLWARVQQKEIRISPVKLPVHTCVDRAIENKTEQAGKKSITLQNEVPEDLSLQCDMQHFDIIIRELLDNAIKFTPEGGQVSIQGLTTAQFTIIDVSDTGIGMDEGMVKRIFQGQVSDIRKGTAGEKSTGLGLFICKAYTDLNSGVITVRSTKNQGTSFYLRLPSAT